MALNISMTTRLRTCQWKIASKKDIVTHMDNETVEADLAMWLENILHPISGKSVAHRW